MTMGYLLSKDICIKHSLWLCICELFHAIALSVD